MESNVDSVIAKREGFQVYEFSVIHHTKSHGSRSNADRIDWDIPAIPKTILNVSSLFIELFPRFERQY